MFLGVWVVDVGMVSSFGGGGGADMTSMCFRRVVYSLRLVEIEKMSGDWSGEYQFLSG